jgi:hypothetical protein
MPDSRKVLFSRRAPDGEGMLRFDLFLWEPESGRVEQVTHLSDVSAADPSPDGRFAVGVRNRYGLSALVQVDLRTGTVQEIPTRVESSDPWVVWNHPRVSPDGRHIAALLHRGRRWRLVALPREGGEPREIGLPGSPAGPPAWSPDGTRLFVATDASGTWNLASVEVGGGKALELTRVTGGAFSAAPAPDGTSLFFLELTAKGINLRQMKIGEGLPPVPREAGGYPLLPPPAIESQPREPAEVAPKQRYNLWRSQVVRPIFGYTVGPDGKAWQLGLEGADVVEQLHWTALGSLGDAAGPRGGALAAAYRGLPVALSLHLFSAVEQPGSQRVVHRPEFDQERRGGLLEASWGRSSFGGSQRVSVGAGWTRVDPAAGDDFDRALASLDARATFRRFRGKSGILLSGALAGSAGRTGGEDWSQVLVTARATGGVGPARLSLSGSLGETAGSPTRFDLFSIGGAGSSLLPAGLDRNRIESPALPHFTQVGEKLERLRAELAGSGLPVLLYGERLRAWDGGAARPDPLEILGAELRAESLLPAELARSIEIYLGVARIKGDSPRFRSTRGYAGLIFRP